MLQTLPAGSPKCRVPFHKAGRPDGRKVARRSGSPEIDPNTVSARRTQEAPAIASHVPAAPKAIRRPPAGPTPADRPNALLRLPPKSVPPLQDKAQG